MILQKVESFPALISRARAESRDSATHKPYTQVELGEKLGVSDSLISQWENGERTPALEMVNLIPRYLRTVTVAEILRSLGYQVEVEPGGDLPDEERALLLAYRELRGTPDLQRVALRLVRSLSEPLEDLEPKPPSRSRRRPVA